MMVVSSRMTENTSEDALLTSLEHALRVADQQVAMRRAELEAAERRADGIRHQVEEYRGDVGIPDDGITPAAGSMTDGIRAYLQSQGANPTTAKDVEKWLIRKGYRTSAKNFYWSVYGALRAMKDVVGVMKEGETLRFAWRESLSKAPAGWRLVDFPRRTSLASRQRQTPEAAKPKTKAKGR